MANQLGLEFNKRESAFASEELISKFSENKTLIFTAYLSENSDQAEDGQVTVQECWYPTVYFYDLNQDKVTWKVQGMEAFISLTSCRKAYFFTNKIWKSLNHKLYSELRESNPDYIRFQEYSSSVYEMDYMQPPILDENAEESKVPE